MESSGWRMKPMQLLSECPILILAFNRPDLVEGSLNQLKAAGARNIWIAVDGPRLGNNRDRNAQEKIKALCKEAKLSNNKMYFAQTNLGCREGVVAGISWFLGHVDAGIILEDDIEVQPTYMEAMAILLKRFKNDRSISSISSHFEFGDYKNDVQAKDSRIFRSPICRVWGWATWRDRWEQHLTICGQLLSHRPLDCFFALPKRYRTADAALRLAACQAGEFDTWDYEWNFTHLYLGASSLTPKGIYCLNHGFRTDATHTTENEAPWRAFSTLPINTSLIKVQPLLAEVPGDQEQLMHQCGYPVTQAWVWEGLRLLKHELKQWLR
jgi:hypothetical protein